MKGFPKYTIGAHFDNPSDTECTMRLEVIRIYECLIK